MSQNLPSGNGRLASRVPSSNAFQMLPNSTVAARAPGLQGAGTAGQVSFLAGRTGQPSPFGFGQASGLPTSCEQTTSGRTPPWASRPGGDSAPVSRGIGVTHPRRTASVQTASIPLPPPSGALSSAVNGPSFANPAPILDASEFPALGGNPGASSASSAAPGLLSTYASQAGTGLPLPSGPAGLGAPRDFSSEDFPALGPGPNDGPQNSLHSLLNGATTRQQQAAHQQEQQSAAAALAHRQGLLGSLGTGLASARNGTGPLAAMMDEQKRQNFAFKSGAAANALPPASSPPGLPPAQSLGQGLGTWSAAGTANGLPMLANGISPAPGSNAPKSSPPSSSEAASSQQPAKVEMPQTAAEQIIVSPADRFGLLGLLHLIKHATPGQSLLSLGSDLSKLGLEMGRRDPLSTTFATPWSDPDAIVEPEFSLPACYNVQPPPATHKIANFTDETLFFIFYAQPRDYMQELAAQELYKHNWRYHKELKLWLTKEAGVEPTQKTSNYERGSYIFFDPLTWEKQKREFVLVYSDLESRPISHLPPPGQAAQQTAATAANLPLS